MKLAQAFVVMGLVVSMSAPAAAQITPIDDIQLYSNTGVPSSPFNNQVATVRGILTALKGTWNSGTHYIQDATGGMNFFDPNAPAFAIGDEIEVTGTVTAFSGEINLSCPCTYNFVNTSTPPAPIEYTVPEFVDNDGSGTVNSADFEIMGWLATVSGNVAFRAGNANPAGPWDQGTFSLADGSGDTMTVFIDRDTRIDTSALQPGTEVQVIGLVSVFNFTLQIKPRFQLDIIINPGNPAPAISNVVPNPWTPVANQAISISATITDNGSVASATLFYRNKGAGAFSSSPMSNVGGNTYTGLIPGTTAAGVEYYIQASDDTAQFATLPGNAPTGFLALAVGTTSIVTIQSTLIPDSGASALSGERVNIEAIVTVAPGELQVSGLSNYVVGEASGGAWSGVFIFEGTGSNILFRGDRVRIAGTVSEFNGITEVVPVSGQAVELVSFGNPMPPLTALSTDVMDVTEAWESVIVGTFRAAVVDTAFGGTDWRLKDANSDSSIYVAPAPGASYVATIGEEMFVTGFLDTRFGRNGLVPRDNADIVPADGTSVGNAPRADVARFESIVPNPFNPSTKISYSVPTKGQVELAIFDVRGRRVSTLVAGPVEVGTHSVVWTGLDDEGAPVSSGVYYARLRDGLRSVSVEKLTLSK